jgi:hypothetical protein
VSPFKAHFLDKYFAYRRRYVDYVAREAPRRARLAVLSEIARLSFVAAGSALCGLIFGTLAVTAAARVGFGAWPVVFGLCSLAAAVFVTLALCGVASAVRDRRPSAGRSPS